MYRYWDLNIDALAHVHRLTAISHSIGTCDFGYGAKSYHGIDD